MQTTDVPDALSPSSIRQVAVASFIGSAIEWYDFYIYGTSAALIFPRVFFPNLSPFAAALASFGTFGVAFFVRPLGGVVFGHYGDRLGRKSMLVITLLLMGGATFLIGLVPTYQQVGNLAPILLVALRSLQGFAVGGEWGGATLMVVEHAPEAKRNYYASWPQTGVPAGLILSTIVFAAFSSLPDESFFAWGWRIPFVLSIVLVAIGLFIRLKVLESPVFTRVKELGAESRAPLIEVLRDHAAASILVIGIVTVIVVQFYVITTFTLAYATTQLGVPRNAMLTGLLLVGIADGTGMIVFARMADRIGIRPVAIWSTASIFLMSYPFFWLLVTGSVPFIWLAMSLWIFAGGALFGITGAFIAELFPARLRYSGISFGFQVASMIGGLAPIIATALTQWSGGASWPVAIYVSLVALAALVAVSMASERYRVPIDDQQWGRRSLATPSR